MQTAIEEQIKKIENKEVVSVLNVASKYVTDGALRKLVDYIIELEKQNECK